MTVTKTTMEPEEAIAMADTSIDGAKSAASCG